MFTLFWLKFNFFSSFCLQFQQAPPPEGRVGAETPPSPPNSGEWEDGQVEVHAAMWGAGHWDQEAENRGKGISEIVLCIIQIKQLKLPNNLTTTELFLHCRCHCHRYFT